MAEVDRPGRAEVTIRDVARQAEVHISTVSRALDPQKASLVAPETRARVLAVAEELGYRPHLVASGLRRGSTRTVGVVVPDLGNPLYAPLARGVTQALDQGGYMPLVADTQDEPGRLELVLGHLLGRRVDAIIATAARASDQDTLVTLAEQGVPVVLAVRTLPESGLPTVIHDDATGGRLAAEHLLALGHRRIAQIPGPLDVEPFRARTQAFAETVQAGGEHANTVEPAGHPTVSDGETAMVALLEAAGDRPPSAVFVHNDLMALGALKALRDRRLTCPDDVSVVGYNDLFFAEHTSPPLTTVRLAAHEVGWLAGSMAIDLVAGTRVDRQRAARPPVLVPPSLVVRASTAPPRA